MDSISCSRGSVVKFMRELERIGLIERKKRGQGLADYIYVKKFIDTESVPVRNPEHKDSEICTSAVSKNKLKDFQNSEPNNTDINKIDISYTDSIHHSRSEYEEMVKENIEYDILKSDFKDDWLDNIVEIMLDVLCSDSKTIRINSSNVPIEQVRERYLSINDMHIRYIDDAFRKHNSEVRNVRAFFITAIYNAPVTMDAFYDAWVKSDMKRGLV